MGERKRVLVIGGNGYLGQHLLVTLAGDGESFPYDLAFTHRRPIPPPQLLSAISPAIPFLLDLNTGDGFETISQSFGQVNSHLHCIARMILLFSWIDTACILDVQPHVVVNCAAISVPRACEVDPAAAMATNVPSSLVNWLLSFECCDPFLIHLSTDQVYEGIKSFYKEEDETVPVNMYGKSKVVAEQFIASKYSNFAILRSSIIYGPQTVAPVEKSLPIQWIDKVLAGGQEVEFFYDEFRCPIYVKDVVNVITSLIKKRTSDGEPMQLFLNIGGSDRVSRMEMAKSVATVRGYDLSLIKSVSASSVDRGVASPADISMDISKLMRLLSITPVSFEHGVKATLESSDVS